MPSKFCIDAVGRKHAYAWRQNGRYSPGARLLRHRFDGCRAIADPSVRCCSRADYADPTMPRQDPKRVALGERLWGDQHLSHDNTRNCLSCHDTRSNGASANARDLAPDGKPLPLNTPTIFNATLNFRLNWEGNFVSLEREAEQALRNPAVMASTPDEVVSKLRADPTMVRQFRDAYESEPQYCRRSGCDRDLRALARHAWEPVRPLARGRS